MSDGGGGAGQECSQRDGAGGYDSGCVVADTFDVGGRSEGMSMASHAGNKRQKTDDAPSSAATLSDEQKRVEDMVMSGRNVRHTLRARANTRCRARAPQPHARVGGKSVFLRLKHAHDCHALRPHAACARPLPGVLHWLRRRGQVVAVGAPHQPAEAALRRGTRARAKPQPATLARAPATHALTFRCSPPRAGLPREGRRHRGDGHSGCA
jgi:hypothetical protein